MTVIVVSLRGPLGEVVEGRTCYAYFHGRDGDGVCSEGCQWFVKGALCPWWWEKEEDWLAAKAAIPLSNNGITEEKKP